MKKSPKFFWRALSAVSAQLWDPQNAYRGPPNGGL